jgi:hypothetical protein
MNEEANNEVITAIDKVWLNFPHEDLSDAVSKAMLDLMARLNLHNEELETNLKQSILHGRNDLEWHE